MSFNFSDSRFISRNGKQSSLHSEHTIYSTIKHSSFFNFKASNPRMETKLFLTVLSLIGYGGVIASIFLNIGTWKANFLFISSGAFIVLKFIRLVIKTWYDAKKQQIELKIMEKESKE